MMLLCFSLASSSFTLKKSAILSDKRLNSKMYHVRWFLLITCLFVCLFVCWNKTRKTILRLLLGGKQTPYPYAIRPPIPNTISVKHCQFEIMVFPRPFVRFHRDRCFNFYCLFLLCTGMSAQTLSPATTCWYSSLYQVWQTWAYSLCLCSLHAGIQMSPDEVVGCDACRHSIAEGTVGVPIRLFQQICSARSALFSCPFA